jgi:cell filamentation protein
LERIEDTTRFDAALLCSMHRAWLGKLYSWAGRYRQVELAKGAFRWPPAALVARNMAAFESGLLRECTPCRPDSVAVVADCVAKVHAELLLIHPFREGNGRLARWLADLMIAQAGLPAPDYGFEGPGSRKRKSQYLSAVYRGYLRDYRALRDFFIEVVERRLRENL